MSKFWEPPADMKEVVGRKSLYVIERWGKGWAVTINRRGYPKQTILCNSPGEVSQLRMKLSDDGLIGPCRG